MPPTDSMDEMPLILAQHGFPVAEMLTPVSDNGRAIADRYLLLAAPDLLAACVALTTGKAKPTNR